MRWQSDSMTVDHGTNIYIYRVFSTDLIIYLGTYLHPILEKNTSKLMRCVFISLNVGTFVGKNAHPTFLTSESWHIRLRTCWCRKKILILIFPASYHSYHHSEPQGVTEQTDCQVLSARGTRKLGVSVENSHVEQSIFTMQVSHTCKAYTL